MKPQKRLKRLTWFCISAVICCCVYGCGEPEVKEGIILDKYYNPERIGTGVGSGGKGPVVVITLESEQFIVIVEEEGEPQTVYCDKKIFFKVKKGDNLIYYKRWYGRWNKRNCI